MSKKYNPIKEHNKWYKKSGQFELVMVKFNVGSGEYTFAARKNLNLQVDDWVIVPTGSGEDVFTTDDPTRWVAMVQVTDVTRNMKHLPKKEKVWQVIDKVTTKKYSKSVKQHGVDQWDDDIPF